MVDCNVRADFRRCFGTGLIELSVVLALVGLLLSLAMPALSTWVSNAHTVSATRSLLTHLRFARSEAIKRNAQVVVCPSRGDYQCLDSGDWRFGWISFVDQNHNRRHDPEEPIVAATQYPDDESLHITFATRQNNGRFVRYRGTGDAWPNGRFLICPEGSADLTRELIIYRSGRARINAARRISDLRCA